MTKCFTAKYKKHEDKMSWNVTSTKAWREVDWIKLYQTLKLVKNKK